MRHRLYRKICSHQVKNTEIRKRRVARESKQLRKRVYRSVENGTTVHVQIESGPSQNRDHHSYAYSFPGWFSTQRASNYLLTPYSLAGVDNTVSVCSLAIHAQIWCITVLLPTPTTLKPLLSRKKLVTKREDPATKRSVRDTAPLTKTSQMTSQIKRIQAGRFA